MIALLLITVAVLVWCLLTLAVDRLVDWIERK